MDATFLQDICVSLQYDPLALKFKSCSNIPNSEDVQYQNFHTLDSKVTDLEPPFSLLFICGSIDHMEVKCPEMILIQDSNFAMGSYIIKDYCMSLKVHANFECSSIDTTF